LLKPGELLIVLKAPGIQDSTIIISDQGITFVVMDKIKHDKSEKEQSFCISLGEQFPDT